MCVYTHVLLTVHINTWSCIWSSLRIPRLSLPAAPPPPPRDQRTQTFPAMTHLCSSGERFPQTLSDSRPEDLSRSWPAQMPWLVGIVEEGEQNFGRRQLVSCPNSSCPPREPKKETKSHIREKTPAIAASRTPPHRVGRTTMWLPGEHWECAPDDNIFQRTNMPKHDPNGKASVPEPYKKCTKKEKKYNRNPTSLYRNANATQRNHWDHKSTDQCCL